MLVSLQTLKFSVDWPRRSQPNTEVERSGGEPLVCHSVRETAFNTLSPDHWRPAPEWFRMNLSHPRFPTSSSNVSPSHRVRSGVHLQRGHRVRGRNLVKRRLDRGRDILPFCNFRGGGRGVETLHWTERPLKKPPSHPTRRDGPLPGFRGWVTPLSSGGWPLRPPADQRLSPLGWER